MMSSKRWSQSWSNSNTTRKSTVNAINSLRRSSVWIIVSREVRRRANIRWHWRIKTSRRTPTNRSRKTLNTSTTRKCLTLDNNSKSSLKTRWKKRPIRIAFNSKKKELSLKNKRETWKSFKKMPLLIWTTKWWRGSWPTNTNSRSSKNRTLKKIWRVSGDTMIRRLSTRRLLLLKKRSL